MDLRNKLVVKGYYLSNSIYKSKYSYILYPILIFYRFFTYWFLSTDLHYKTEIGNNLAIFHGMGLVVNPSAVLGDRVILRHNVTIGNYGKDGQVSGSPTIGNDVEIGCGAVVLGAIIIGNNVVIAANSIITKNVPSNSKCYGFNLVRPYYK